MLNGEQFVHEVLQALSTFSDQNFMIGPNVPAMNEDAISNLLVDIDFLEGEFTRIGKGHLNSVFAELHSVNWRLLPFSLS